MMYADWPLWRIRNLDVAVVASLTFAVVLFNAATLGRMVLAAYPALSYLAFRCACFALLPRRSPRPSVPLYEHATRRWSAREQLRLLRMIAGACALVVVMVGLSSLRVVDVGYAVMQGATAILHGLSPYGHIAGIVHGDT